MKWEKILHKYFIVVHFHLEIRLSLLQSTIDRRIQQITRLYYIYILINSISNDTQTLSEKFGCKKRRETQEPTDSFNKIIRKRQRQNLKKLGPHIRSFID